MNVIYSEDYLMHHGVKGQKWGVRRYQNEDGTRTDEGKSRYGSKKKKGLSTGAIIGISVGGAALLGAGIYALSRTPAGKKAVQAGKNKFDDLKAVMKKRADDVELNRAAKKYEKTFQKLGYGNDRDAMESARATVLGTYKKTQRQRWNVSEEAAKQAGELARVRPDFLGHNPNPISYTVPTNDWIARDNAGHARDLIRNKIDAYKIGTNVGQERLAANAKYAKELRRVDRDIASYRRSYNAKQKFKDAERAVGKFKKNAETSIKNAASAMQDAREASKAAAAARKAARVEAKANKAYNRVVDYVNSPRGQKRINKTVDRVTRRMDRMEKLFNALDDLY